LRICGGLHLTFKDVLRVERMVSTKIGVQNCALGYYMYHYNLHVTELAFDVG